MFIIIMSFIFQFKYAKIQSRENGGIKKGVIFVTYSSLIGESSQSHSKYDTRMKQLFKWCGKNFDGVVSLGFSQHWFAGGFQTLHFRM